MRGFKKPISDELIVKMIKLRQQGLSQQQIADSLGVSRAVVQYRTRTKIKKDTYIDTDQKREEIQRKNIIAAREISQFEEGKQVKLKAKRKRHDIEINCKIIQKCDDKIVLQEENGYRKHCITVIDILTKTVVLEVG